MHRLVLFSLYLSLSLLWASPVLAQDSAPCPYPEGYLDDVLKDLTETGENIGQVDTTDPGAIGLAYVGMYQLRHRYENMTPNLPDCALRGHTYFTNLLGNWEDILGLALATHAHPEAAEQYIAEIGVVNERIAYFTPLLLAEFFPPIPPTPLPPTATPLPVLSTFYINTANLNVRIGPGGDFESVGVVPGGLAVDVIGLDTLSDGTVWYEIAFPSSPTGRGWVFSGFVSEERPSEFPVIQPSMTPSPTP
jgi:hypothetical protein